MGIIGRIIGQLGSLGRERVHAPEVQREFSFHIDMETQRLMQQGLTEEEARRQAVLAFGGLDRYEEELRDGWARRSLTDLRSDVRFALRALATAPMFTATAVATLAIGLGGTAAVFTMVKEVLLAPLPYANEAQIVRIFNRNSQTNRWSLSVADYNGIRDWQRSFSAVTVIRFGEMALSGPQPSWVQGAAATEGLFETLGIGVARGRTYLPSDTLPGAAPVAVLSDELARRHFGEVNPVGRTIVLDRVTYNVIGVLSPEFAALGGVPADVWPLLRLETPERRGPFGLVALARLRPGVTLAAATADLGNISDRLFPIYAANFSDRTAKLTPYPLREILFGDATKSLGVLLAAVALVLLIALANVTNLVLVRASGRRRELALRTALGAERGRLTRLLLTENIVLSLLGGVLAIVVAVGALRVLQAIGPSLPRMQNAQLDFATMAFTLLLSVACGIVIALYPIAFSTTRGMAQALRSGDRRASSGRGTRAFQDSLVVAEFALALPLLAGAALLLHSFLSLQRVDSGIDPENVVAMRISLPSSQYGEPEQRGQFWRDALREVSAVPGVAATGVTSSLPPDNFGDTNNFNLVDKPVAPGAAEHVSPWASITPQFFPAVGARLLSGRAFDERDTGDAPPVLIVSRAWAERYYPGESPIGKTLVEGGCYDCPRSTVIGVVNDIKYSGLAGNGDGVYVPYEQWPRSMMYLVVRTNQDPTTALGALRAAVHRVDPELPLDDAELMPDRLAAAVAEPRHWTLLVGGFAGIAVLLAGLGVFGVMSYIVSQQQREIGVRLALGAAPNSVITLILRRGLMLAGLGTAIGIFAALQGTKLLEHVLFGVSATDPRTLASVAIALIAIATLACYLPGRRAAAVDPVRIMASD